MLFKGKKKSENIPNGDKKDKSNPKIFYIIIALIIFSSWLVFSYNYFIFGRKNINYKKLPDVNTVNEINEPDKNGRYTPSLLTDTDPKQKVKDQDPVDYYDEQLGLTFTLNGYDYQLIQRASMNIPIRNSTDYAGVLKKPTGSESWEKYIKILSTPYADKNNPYHLWYKDGLYLLIVDQTGAGSSEGVGKIIKIDEDSYSLINCFYYGIDYFISLGLDALISADSSDFTQDGSNCNNYEIIFQ
jgi:hypothetical protein